MLKLSSSELLELEKFIEKVSFEGFSYALSKSSPNFSQYPIFLPLQILSIDQAIAWLENLMQENNITYS